MIQDSHSSINDCYGHPNDFQFFQNIHRLDDQQENIINIENIAKGVQYNGQQQIFNANLQLHHQQQQYIIENPYEQQSPEDQQLLCVNYCTDPPKSEETANNAVLSDLSETSTSEELTINDEEQYAYLKELNSDNLMQISQQSVLQEMILQHHFEGKPNLNVLPIFEEHDVGNHNFKIIVPTNEKKQKTNWVYSETLNKLYIRMGSTFTTEVVCTPKLPLQQLRIRVFLCFAKEVCEPVRRCQNHLSKDNEPYPAKRESVLRCENPDAEYSGSSEGKSIKERYSVSVPVNICALQSDKTIKQPIALRFTCQNSCIGRKATGIMFLLEGMNGEILSQRLLNVRICTCPKRDKKIDERTAATKRVSSNEDYEIEPKKRRISDIKDENSDYNNMDENCEIKCTENGAVRFEMEVSCMQYALLAIKYAIGNESADILDKDKRSSLSKECYKKLKNTYEKYSSFCQVNN